MSAVSFSENTGPSLIDIGTSLLTGHAMQDCGNRAKVSRFYRKKAHQD
jgi:hypothetical protein